MILYRCGLSKPSIFEAVEIRKCKRNNQRCLSEFLSEYLSEFLPEYLSEFLSEFLSESCLMGINLHIRGVWPGFHIEIQRWVAALCVDPTLYEGPSRSSWTWCLPTEDCMVRGSIPPPSGGSGTQNYEANNKKKFCLFRSYVYIYFIKIFEAHIMIQWFIFKAYRITSWCPLELASA